MFLVQTPILASAHTVRLFGGGRRFDLFSAGLGGVVFIVGFLTAGGGLTRGMAGWVGRTSISVSGVDAFMVLILWGASALWPLVAIVLIARRFLRDRTGRKMAAPGAKSSARTSAKSMDRS